MCARKSCIACEEHYGTHVGSGDYVEADHTLHERNTIAHMFALCASKSYIT